MRNRDQYERQGDSAGPRRGRWFGPGAAQATPATRSRSRRPQSTRAAPEPPPASSPRAKAAGSTARQQGCTTVSGASSRATISSGHPARPSAVTRSQHLFRNSRPISEGRSECSPGTSRAFEGLQRDRRVVKNRGPNRRSSLQAPPRSGSYRPARAYLSFRVISRRAPPPAGRTGAGRARRGLPFFFISGIFQI